MADFTFVCPTEIQAFSENHGAFAEVGAQVLAISTDSHHTHLAWIRTAREDGGLGPIAIPLVADTSKQISRRYGVLVEDSDDPMFGAALRGLFIIGPDGRIRSLQMNDDQVGRNWQEALRIIKGRTHRAPQRLCVSSPSPSAGPSLLPLTAVPVLSAGFQWASEHDEVCPASWTQPGDSTLKATPDGIKDFYRKQSASSSPRPAAASSKTASHADL